jgi:hypothetical protein
MLAALLIALVALVPQAPPDRPDCPTWQECRDQALQAADRQEFELFHDLAWRAVQKGPKNDPALMQILARAQSLSGRPLDAVVMLERLAALGVATDAVTNDDFRRVRALPGWPALKARLDAAAEPAASPAEPEIAPSESASRAPDPELAASAAATLPSPEPSAPAVGPEAASVRIRKPPPLEGNAAEALRFTTRSFTPAGLAYDHVSNRFIVGDRDARKLTVVDEASHRVANLAAARTAGFGVIDALEIDPREGDLWVVSSPAPSAATDSSEFPDLPTATLHKLQLISGRVLYAVPLDPSAGAARFTDVAVTPRGSVLVLDALGGRVFVARPKARKLELAVQLDAPEPASIAPASESVAYVADARGILRVDLSAGRSSRVGAAGDVTLDGIARLRWRQGALLAVQAAGDGTYKIVRLKLNASGQKVLDVALLDASLRMSDPTAASITGNTLYYLSEPQGGTDEGPREDTIVRRVDLQ